MPTDDARVQQVLKDLPWEHEHTDGHMCHFPGKDADCDRPEHWTLNRVAVEAVVGTLLDQHADELKGERDFREQLFTLPIIQRKGGYPPFDPPELRGDDGKDLGLSVGRALLWLIQRSYDAEAAEATLAEREQEWAAKFMRLVDEKQGLEATLATLREQLVEKDRLLADGKMSAVNRLLKQNETLRQELATLRDTQTPGWEPISDTHKNGEWWLVCFADHPNSHAMSACYQYGQWKNEHGGPIGRYDFMTPTHAMKMPTLPKLV